MVKINFRRLFKKFNYYLICPGITFFDFIFLTLDNEFCLYRKEHPPEPLFLTSLKTTRPEFSKVTFYADSISYLHDTPVNIGSLKKRPSAKPLLNHLHRKYPFYEESIETIYRSIQDIRLNGSVSFKWDKAYDERIDVNLYKKYSKVKESIQLYSMALKQSDVLSEFLCYYRIIENITKDNGKKWIKKNIHKIEKYNFGFLCVHPQHEIEKSKRQKSLFSLYRQKAMKRIKELSNVLSECSIEKYLYEEVRCGIAHGKTRIKFYDYDTHLREISKDIFIMKLLSRIAIESAAKNESCI